MTTPDPDAPRAAGAPARHPGRTGSDSSAAPARSLLRPRLLAALLLLPPLLVYLPHLGKGLVSEDFLLVALHRERPPWNDLAATFAGPWLDMTIFEFYRPVATLVFAAEAVGFGAWSAGYNLVHLGVHLLSVLLLWLLLRALLRAGRGLGAEGRTAVEGVARTNVGQDPAVGGAAIGDAARGGTATLELAALAGALFFALHPLAPNAVLFAASFATVFGAAATLGAALLWVRARPLASLGLYLVALGCYESSVALVPWLVLHELSRRFVLGGRDASAGRRPLGDARSRGTARWRRSGRSMTLFLFAAVTAAYLALRVSLFGEALGGYGDVAARLRGIDGALVLQALRALARLPSPWFGPGAGAWPEALLGVALVAGAALWAATGAASSRRALLHVVASGSAWALLFLAPFSFPLLVPAVGRYGYLAAAGVAIVLASLLAQRRAGRAVVVAAVVLLLGRNALELRRHLGWMEQAADTASRIAAEIERVAGEIAPADAGSGGGADEAVGSPIFVAGYPLFLRGESGIELAQVYHYGLRSAVSPPFRERAIAAYPLPALSEGDPGRLAREHPVYVWSHGERRLHPLGNSSSGSLGVSGDASDAPADIAPEGPADGAALSLDELAAVRLHVPDFGAGARAHVVVSASGNYTIAGPAPAAGGAELRLPVEFILFWAGLEPGPQLWWLEVRDAGGGLLASSEPRWLTIGTVSRSARRER